MSRPRAPWWIYVLAASFLGYFALREYCYLWGPEPLGVGVQYGPGSLLLLSVSPNSPAERAGLKAGNPVLAGRYKLERRRGRGGMGTVYEALDTALERRVAVKVIRDDLVGSAEAAERFRWEARRPAGRSSSYGRSHWIAPSVRARRACSSQNWKEA